MLITAPQSYSIFHLYHEEVHLTPCSETDDYLYYEYGALVEREWQGTTELLGEKPAPVPPSLP